MQKYSFILALWWSLALNFDIIWLFSYKRFLLSGRGLTRLKQKGRIGKGFVTQIATYVSFITCTVSFMSVGSDHDTGVIISGLNNLAYNQGPICYRTPIKKEDTHTRKHAEREKQRQRQRGETSPSKIQERCNAKESVYFRQHCNIVGHCMQ